MTHVWYFGHKAAMWGKNRKGMKYRVILTHHGKRLVEMEDGELVYCPFYAVRRIQL